MEQLFKALYDAGHKSFDFSIERLVVLLRIVLTLFCLVIVATDFDNRQGLAQPLIIILATYAVFGLCIAVLPILGKFRTGWQLPVHFIDVGATAVLMSLGHVYSATFFILYIFVLLSATFRWNFPGALWTTISLLLLQTLPPWGNGHMASFVLQSSFVMIVGGVFMFFGAWRERSETRLAQIAAWPENPATFYDKNEDRWLITSISHISKVLRTPRVMVLWELAQEPYYVLSIFADGKYRREQVVAKNIDNVVAAELDDVTFAIETSSPNYYRTSAGLRKIHKEIFENALVERFKIQSVCSAAFKGALCKGRILFLDRANWGEDDLVLADIAASRLRIELEYRITWSQLQESAAARERVHLASDLHDGVLQSLTAAGMRLKLMMSTSNPKIKRELNEIRKILLDEQLQIRSFVEERLTRREMKNFNLHHQLRRETEKLERQWDCVVILSVTPEDTTVGQKLAQQIRLLLAEAVANGAKHGGAKQVQVAVERASDALQVHISDNGRGIKELAGIYHRNELVALGFAPKSISDRVTELGGDFSLSSSSDGVALHIILPCIEQTAVKSDAPAYSLD